MLSLFLWLEAAEGVQAGEGQEAERQWAPGLSPPDS